ncbi:MAG: GntP family permease [Kangiellaceae bacterium]|nr:GntP family permease [Kangiellaceae bacterium]
MSLSMIGLILGLLLLIVLTIRGMNLMVAGPLCALLVAMTSGIPLFQAGESESNLVTSYMSGFSGFVQAWFMMFLLGSLFGKLMEESGSADSVSQWIVGKLGMQHAVLAIVFACAILTYGGVSLFVVAFSVYPMALSLFKQANLPRRFIPAALAFGSVTFTMTSAGSPEVQNWIPIKYLGTTPYAGWEVSIVVALFMGLFGFWWLRRMIGKAVANGETFQSREDDPAIRDSKLPSPILSLIPLALVLISSFVLHQSLQEYALMVALLIGVLSCWIINHRYIQKLGQAINMGTTGALIAIGNTAAVVGFGSVAKATPAFAVAVEFMTNLPGNELIGAAVAVSAIAGLTGSASGGQAIALPILAPHYIDAGVDPEQLHRVVAISSGALDSLPHNGYVVTTIRAICGETHKAAYGPMGAVTVVVPVLGVILAIALFLI